MRYTRVHVEHIGYELAPVVVTSDEIEERLAPVYRALRIQPGQLEHITGIAERRYWEPGFPVSRGAAVAAQKALSASAVPADAIETLIYGAVCREHFEPATACHVAAAMQSLGIEISPRAHLYDVSNACLGVLSGMLDVANRIELGQIRAGMVVSCETAREINDIAIARMLEQPTMERFKESIATMTGGAAAVAVILSDGSFSGSGDGGPRRRLRGGVVEAAPEHHMLCRWGIEAESPDPDAAYRQFATTDAAAVLEHGVALGARTWEAFLAQMAWTPDDVDRTICHQVGAGHREVMLRTMGVSPENDFVSYEYLGNTGTTALPLAAALAEERGFLSAGQRVGLLGIGSGLNCMMLGVDW